MALNGSVTIDATPNSCDLLVFSWEATQDQENNTSAINWKMDLVASEEYGLIYGVYVEKDWIVTIDGQETTGTADINIDYGETKTLASGTTVIAHEPDGTKTFDFAFGINMDISGWGAKAETHECPDCGGTGLINNLDECSICEGTGSLTTTTEGTYIGWQRGSGTVELDPIAIPEEFDIISWMCGYLLSLCAPVHAIPPREPIGYLYGHVAGEDEKPTHNINGVDYVGVVAPNLPTEHKYNKTDVKFDYAVILYWSSPNIYPLLFTDQPLLVQVGNLELAPINYPYYVYEYEFQENGAWQDTPNYTGKKPLYFDDPTLPLTSIGATSRVIWTSHNIFNEDGSIYLAAIDPIPVYE